MLPGPFSWACLALLGRAAAAVVVTPVATAARFREAFSQGAEHIVITEHLDLRDEEDLLNESRYKFKVTILPRTSSVTGNCETRPDLPGLEYWEPGQCVLIFSAMSGIQQNRAAGPLWLHNLYVLMARPDFSREHRWAVYLDSGRPLYLTSITIDGNATSFAATSFAAIGSGRAAYYEQALRIGSELEANSGLSTGAVAERLQVINYHAGQASPVEIYEDTMLIDGLFSANWVYAHQDAAPGAIFLKNSRSALALENCRFHSNTGYDELGGTDVAATSNATRVYSDSALSYYTYTRGNAIKQQALPLDDAPKTEFMSLEEAQYVTLQSQVQEAVSLLEAPLAPGASSPPSSPPIAAIVGVVAGVVAALLCVVAGLLLWRCRTRTKRQALDPPPSEKHADAGPSEVVASPLEARAVTQCEPTEYLTATNTDPDYTYEGAPLGKSALSDIRTGPLRSASHRSKPSKNDVITMTVWSGGETTSRPTKNDLITMTMWSGNTGTTSRGAAADLTLSHPLRHDGAAPGTSPGTTAALKPPAIEVLEDALDCMHSQRQLLAGRWELLNAAHRRVGGQGIVQFIKDAQTGEGLVVKFFLDYMAFEREAVLYGNPKIRKMMAAVVDMQDNCSGDTIAPNGLQLPPFIVLEQGRSLNEWALVNEPDYITSFQVLLQIVKRLQLLHASGLVHRDIKPANILWRSNVGAWTLIDFGCAAGDGSVAGVAASVPYAPPEVALAWKKKRSRIHVDASMDIWSLGVVIYELLVGERAFPGRSRSEIIDALTSSQPLPWEEGSARADLMKKLGIVKRVVKGCLSRDPASRPSAESLLMTMDSLFCSVTTVQDMTQA